jgi:hypothetical protein
MALQFTKFSTVSDFKFITGKIYDYVLITIFVLFIPIFVVLIIILSRDQDSGRDSGRDNLTSFEIFLNAFQQSLFTTLILTLPHYYFTRRKVLSLVDPINHPLL